MSKLKRYDSFESLKADTAVAFKTSIKKERSLKDLFADLRRYRITKGVFSNRRIGCNAFTSPAVRQTKGFL